uniref:Telomerase reverse transcriptase n=1 Tax=Oryza punctata TaxID=4537 RepID=A0A0E0MLK3_ORYPU
MPRRRRRRAASGGQVPPELRLAYGARALTLGRAVFSLLPSPRHRESPCPACRGRAASGCLACRRWEHLLRDGDPVAYRRLITRAVCAVAADDLSVPPPPRYTPGNSGHSQARLVREMMKSLVADQSRRTKNVLCHDLHEGGQTICISDLVSSSSWNILLHRIGDLVMCYLLRSLVFHSMWFCEILYLQVLLRENVNPKLQKQNVIHATCGKVQTWRKTYLFVMTVQILGFILQLAALAKLLLNKAVKNNPKIQVKDVIVPNFLLMVDQESVAIAIPRTLGKGKGYTVGSVAAKRSSNFNMSNGPSENLAGKMNDQAQSFELTVDNTSFARSNDDSSLEIKEINATILSSEKSPRSVFNIRGSQGLSCHHSLSEVQCQSTCPQVGPSGYLHLNGCSICFNCIISNASKHVAPDVTKNDGKAHYPPGGKTAYYDQSFSQLEAYSTHQQVTSFVWAVLKRIIPEPLLGNSFGKRSLRTNIWKFIKLRRFETFQLSDCIGDLKVSHYSWLSNIEFSNCFCSAITGKQTGSSSGAEEQKQNNILHCWISWLFSDIVIPVVHAYFYVTERESKRYDVFYYPKSVWRDLTSNAIASLNKKNFRILRGEPRKAVRHLNCSSRVRFLPKAKDMRPLVNFRAKSKDAILNKCHLIMKKLRDEKPEMFGSSVFDYNNVHQNLSQFISSKRSQLMKKLKVYIVVADVSKAFDCVSHDMVLKMIDDAFKCDEYTVRKCSKLSSSGGIFVDQGTICRILKEQFRHLLYEQIKCNILKIGQKYYLQQVGIAQGSKLSPNLCSLYYGHLENSVVSKFLHDSKLNAGEAVSEPEYLLMRFIDDFIFISFSMEHAQKFLNRMGRGFVFYNCYMNDSKYGFNFCAGNSEPSSSRLYRGDDGVSFMPWSDITIISTITVKMHSSTKYIHSKLCHYMRPKCHPIFYDSNINSPGTIRVNIYQAFLLCAMKFHCYIRSISDANVSKLELLQVIKRTFRYMHSLIVRRMQDVELHYNVRPVLKLRRKETIWLGLTAYIRVLQQKQSRYKDLLTLLTTELGRYCHLGHECDTLHYAVDDSHSSMRLQNWIPSINPSGYGSCVKICTLLGYGEATRAAAGREKGGGEEIGHRSPSELELARSLAERRGSGGWAAERWWPA